MCRLMWLGIFLCVCHSATASPATSGSMKPLGEIHFAQDDDVKCLLSALETGDPATGPSTFILKVPSGCVVPWHSHTAQEQAVVIRGTVMMGLLDQAPMRLAPGGFGVMEGKAPHQFSCTAKTACLMIVAFNGAYDIFWGKEKR